MTLKSYKSTYTSAAAAAFGGNPNRTISAISTSGGIICSRTSGKTPCFVQVSASAISATGATVPYEDLDYSWDFDDPSSTETFTNHGVGGGTVNSNDDQHGPEAAHCYRSAGTYTITLTIRGKNGTSPFTVTTVTQDIVVSAFTPAANQEFWFDSVSGSDANDGLSIGAPKQTLSALNTILATGADNRRINIKRGSVYQGSTSLTLAQAFAGLRINAYDTGDDPQFDISSGTNPTISVGNGGSSSPGPKSDIVFSDIKFSNSGTVTFSNLISLSFTGNDSAVISDVYFDNCTSEATQNGSNFLIQALADHPECLVNWGLWNCVAIAPAVPGVEQNGMYTKGLEWFFVMGGSWEGGSTDGTLEHHIYPSVQRHSLYRWIDFKTGAGRNFCINTDWSNGATGALEYAEYVLIDGCNMTGVKRAFDLGESSGNDPTKALFRNVLAINNDIYDLTGDNIFPFACATSVTLRGNHIWGCEGGTLFRSDAAKVGALLACKWHENYVHRSSTVSSGNLYDFNSASFTVLQEATDNIIVDERAISQMMSVPFPQQAGALIDRNQYYAPNDGGENGWRDLTTEKTFAQWQAAGFDTNGSVADPGWTDADNGDFS